MILRHRLSSRALVIYFLIGIALIGIVTFIYSNYLIQRIKTETVYTTYMGETETDSVTETTIFKVEKVEEITVDAGTFNCFRIVEYDEDGNKLNTYWHSDTVKQNVKEINHEDGSTVELKSYSLH